MDCYYVAQIEKNFKNYLENLAEDDEKIYKWKFYRGTPTVLGVDVKNISFSGNKELVVLKAMTFFDENGKNFYHTIFKSALEELHIQSINNYKNLEKDEFFSFMVNSLFDCQRPRLCLVNSENNF